MDNMDSINDLPPPPYSLHEPHSSLQDPASVAHPTLTFPNEKKIPAIQDEGPVFVSGAAYFAMRPCQALRKLPILTYHVPLLRRVGGAPPRLPSADSTMRERDLTRDDWQAFLNHLGLQLPQDAQAGPSRYSCSDESAVFPEAEHLIPPRINAVTREWNEGFFLPRGVQIVLNIAPYRKLSIHSTGGTIRLSTSGEQIPKSPSDHSIGLALYHAVSKGNAKLVETLLDKGATANTKPSYAKPALTQVVEKNNWHIVQMLLERGQPDLEATTPAGPTALYVAVSKGLEKLVELLMKYGADVSKKPPGSEPMLYKATSKGFTEIVEMLLESHDIAIDATPPGGNSSLYQSFEKADRRLMDILLLKGANPDIKPCGGSTLLYKAAGKGDLRVSRKLLEYGADPDATPPGGRTALHVAVSKGQEAIARTLIDYGADIHLRPTGGNPALWVAAEKSYLPICQILLERGAEVDAAASNTALWHAVKRGDITVARFLLEHGADPEKTAAYGETALMIAACKCKVEMASMLVSYGANPHRRKSGSSETPVSRAGKVSHYEVLTAMLDAELARLSIGKVSPN